MIARCRPRLLLCGFAALSISACGEADESPDDVLELGAGGAAAGPLGVAGTAAVDLPGDPVVAVIPVVPVEVPCGATIPSPPPRMLTPAQAEAVLVRAFPDLDVDGLQLSLGSPGHSPTSQFVEWARSFSRASSKPWPLRHLPW